MARNIGVDTTSSSAKDIAIGSGKAAAAGAPFAGVFQKAVVVEIITTPDDLINLFDDEPEEGDADLEVRDLWHASQVTAARRWYLSSGE